ncbi:MAG: hypothetical protein HC927_04380 [Deltaproteobacteria bacterium]|nr:hypothetical protein [Deltaproteobacteria bacterium]
MAQLLLAHHPPLREVVLSACHSEYFARQLAMGGLAAVGLRGVGHAEAVVEFSRGLYDAIVAKRSFDFAVAEGLRAVGLHGHSLAVEANLGSDASSADARISA